MKDGEADGFAARFTAPATHIVFDKSGIKMLAGARCVSLGCAECVINYSLGNICT